MNSVCTSTGIIPALAGNTPVKGPVAESHADHPRSRGEYFMQHQNEQSELGSSPLSRGILGVDVPTLLARGIIPALAGNTVPSRSASTATSDHPRSRGEYPCAPTSSLTLSGSSPLSRGIQQGTLLGQRAGRIIPALAGNTPPIPEPRRILWDHPRSRGEYPRTVVTQDGVLGSSPLSRGILGAGRTLQSRLRSSPLSRGIPYLQKHTLGLVPIIPALAGNTYVHKKPLIQATDHPRSRGEYSRRGIADQMLDRSSPLSRGIPLFSEGILVEPYDHPRSRGEYHSVVAALLHRLRSSPLSRGIRFVWGRWSGTAPIIPALAGNTSATQRRTFGWPDHPRSRGEYGGGGQVRPAGGRSSPLSRGIHLLTRDFISRTCRILGTPSSHVSASRSHSPRVCDGHPPGGVGRLARHLKDLDGPSGSAPRSRLVPMDHPMSGRTYLARS